MKEMMIAYAFCAVVIVGIWFGVRQLIRFFSGDFSAPPKEEGRPPRSSHRPRIHEL